MSSNHIIGVSFISRDCKGCLTPWLIMLPLGVRGEVGRLIFLIGYVLRLSVMLVSAALLWVVFLINQCCAFVVKKKKKNLHLIMLLFFNCVM